MVLYYYNADRILQQFIIKRNNEIIAINGITYLNRDENLSVDWKQ